MNLSNNQIALLIGLVVIVVLAFVSDIKIRVDVGPEYSFEDECEIREKQQCPDSDSASCFGSAHQYCNKLNLPDKP